MTRRPRRPWLLGLVLFLCAAVLAAGAGVVLGSRGQPPAAAQPGGTAAPSAPLPGESQTQADLITMQSALNSGSVSQQAALLAPPLKFASGSGPVVPPGKTITIQPGTLHSSGQSGTVQARLSDGTAVTLGLHSTGRHWRLYDAQAGSVQTRAATTGQPVTAQLLSAIDRINYVPAPDEIGQRTPVIFIHGYGGHGSDWGSTSTYGKPGDPNYGQPDDPTSMLYQVNQVPGTYVLSFNYDTGGPESANTKWVDNAASGPAFTRYLNQVAAVSKKAHGPGKVIVVAFSMGGLVTRYAAANGAADAIAMVTTIGTPNRGSFMGDVISFACFANSALGQGPGKLPHGLCARLSGASGMSVFNSKISQLPMLPSSISTVHAIAGDQHLVWKMLNATVDASVGGDGVVPLWSALAKRGVSNDTFDPVMNPLVPANWSAMHLELQKNARVMQLVSGYVAKWIREHPVQAPPAALGGDAYWLADGGTWFVHGAKLQIYHGAATDSEIGLVGDETWNDYANKVIGHAHLVFNYQDDGSLAGTYGGGTTYTYPSGSPPAGWSPAPGAPQDGQTVTLVPVGPHHAKSVYNGDSPGMYAGGNTNWCQADLPDASQYCGA